MKKKELRRETSKVLLIGLLLGILRWLPARPYNRMLNKLMKTVHRDVFPNHAGDFADIVKFSPKVSKVYKNSMTETAALLSQFPQLKSQSAILGSNVRTFRKKVGLPL